MLYGAPLARPTSSAVEKAAQAPRRLRSCAASTRRRQRLAAVGGDAAQLALAEKLVDGLKTRDELRALHDRARREGRRRDNTFRQVSFDDYLAQSEPR